MKGVIIGVDPHKLSATIEVVDQTGSLLGSGRFTTDKAGYTAMRSYVKTVAGPGVGGRGRQRRRPSAGPAAGRGRRTRASTCRPSSPPGHGSSTPATTARPTPWTRTRSRWSRSRTPGLRVVAPDGELEALRMLTDRRDELARQRVQTVNRLQRLLSELIPGQRKKDLSALQAKAMLATVRPRDLAGKTRRRIAAEELADLVAVDTKLKKIKAELKAAVVARGSTLMEIPGVGPAGAARILADVGDVARFADRNRFASWTGTAPLDASSGEQIRHRLSRAGNRRMNHVLHIAAIVQLRHDTEGRAYYRRKLAAGKTPMEALRCLKRRISDVIYRHLVADARASRARQLKRAREGTAGRLKNPARSTCPRTSTLRISHFPDPQHRRYARPPARRPRKTTLEPAP